MGLLNLGAKKKEAEDMVLKALFKVDLLDNLIKNIQEEAEGNNPWITTCQGYYDGCTRVVTIAADFCDLKWVEVRYQKDAQGKDQRVEEVKGQLTYSYTASGYIPLHSHINEKGSEDVSVSRVIYLWTTLVHERLQAKLEGCQFEEVIEDNSYSFFRYNVPGLTWKDWF